MTIVLPEGTAERLTDGMAVGGATELPFFAPAFWCVNGDNRLKALGGAQYFGGWACDAGDLEKAREEWGQENIPSIFQASQIETSDGKTLNVFTARSLLVAPIGSRTTWFLQDGTRLSSYVQGARQHAQVICLLANKLEDGTYDILGPVMLTAKGFQAKNMLDSFVAWDRATRQARGTVAPGVPAWCFYLAIGTFGNDRKQVMVGKRSQSPITPISAFIPKEITPELIEKLYVNGLGVNLMVEYLEDMQDWLHAYDTRTGNGNGNGNDSMEEMYAPEEQEVIPF